MLLSEALDRCPMSQRSVSRQRFSKEQASLLEGRLAVSVAVGGFPYCPGVREDLVGVRPLLEEGQMGQTLPYLVLSSEPHAPDQ